MCRSTSSKHHGFFLWSTYLNDNRFSSNLCFACKCHFVVGLSRDDLANLIERLVFGNPSSKIAKPWFQTNHERQTKPTSVYSPAMVAEGCIGKFKFSCSKCLLIVQIEMKCWPVVKTSTFLINSMLRPQKVHYFLRIVSDEATSAVCYLRNWQSISNRL